MSNVTSGILLMVMLSACANMAQSRVENCRDDTAITEIDVLHEKLRAEEQRSAALQLKLDALKAIEQQLQQRQAPSAEATK